MYIYITYIYSYTSLPGQIWLDWLATQTEPQRKESQTQGKQKTKEFQLTRQKMYPPLTFCLITMYNRI